MAKIGIIGAMELEVDALKAAMEVKNTVTRAGMEFKEGTLNGADVVVVRSGIGKVNAALCVQILVDLFQITHVINTGVAGSLNADLDIGDILISKGTVNASLATPREIFIEALRYQAVSLILVHNHPSGDPEPSEEDRLLTRRMDEAGKLIGIRLLDHIIIGDASYVSFRERGLL